MRAPPIHIEFRFLAAFAIAVALCAGSSAGAQSPQCAVPMNAMLKVFESPFHMNMVDTAGTDKGLHHGQPTVSEETFVNNAMYIHINGKWVRSPVSVSDMRKDMLEKLKTDKSTCTHVRDESVNGESASMWSVHSPTEDGDTDSQLWISKSRGVVLRMDIRIDVGGAMGKSHMVSNYDYANIHAPAGVQ
jgi:hypothetical protein